MTAAGTTVVAAQLVVHQAMAAVGAATTAMEGEWGGATAIAKEAG